MLISPFNLKKILMDNSTLEPIDYRHYQFVSLKEKSIICGWNIDSSVHLVPQNELQLSLKPENLIDFELWSI